MFRHWNFVASVGYFAAGVAHEINNPLGIIAGYGERAMQLLSVGLNDNSLPRTQKALAVICEEVFGCKQITDRLLSLARQGSDDRQPVSIAIIAETVVSTLAGLGMVGNRKLALKIDSQPDLAVLGNEGELKQVLLNLIIDAERQAILAGLKKHGGNRTAAAAELGISRRKLHYWLRDHRGG